MKKIAGRQSKRDQVVQRARDLTNRQREIVTLVCAGHSNKIIARRLRLGEGTVKTHLHTILLRLGVENRGAVMDALGNELPQTLSDRAKNKERT
jgi:DNA-binding NarL/FixJ family response regulator